MFFDGSHDFMRQTGSYLRFVQHHGSVQPTSVCNRGMGKKESGGLGEKTRKGKGDCSRAAPLSLGCLPKILVERYCVSPARRASKIRPKKMVTRSRVKADAAS